MKILKYIDLFNGLGAFHMAFDYHSCDKIKYECVFASDINEDVRDIYEENYGLKPKGDINEINVENDIPDFDILCAGFPCQPFSISGKKEGFENPTQGNLFFKILEILDKKRPSTFILENVKNLETIHNSNTFNTIKNELEKRNYNIFHKVLNAKDYGSPQSRQRIYIIGLKKGQDIIGLKNESQDIIDLKNESQDIIGLKKGQGRTFHFPPAFEMTRTVADIIDYTINDFLDLNEKYDLVKNDNENSHLLYRLINKETGKGGRQGERVYSINHSGPTVCAQSGGVGANTGLYQIEEGKIRTLTVNETLKMFGFTDNYKYDTLKEKYVNKPKLIKKKMLYFLGNSIVVNVLKEIIKNIE